MPNAPLLIALAQTDYRIGDLQGNLDHFLGQAERAAAEGAQLVVFPELAICGYDARDWYTYPHFVEQALNALTELAERAHEQNPGLAILIGGPAWNEADTGKELSNAAWWLEGGQARVVARKALLPTYDVFDEYRYFEPCREEQQAVEFEGVRLAITICEDLWNTTETGLYDHRPMDELVKQGVDLMVNLAASPFHVEQPQKRLEILRWNALQYNSPLLYVNTVGAHTELIFDGGSLGLDASGELVGQAPRFAEALTFFEVEKSNDEVKLSLHTKEEEEPEETQAPAAETPSSLIHQAIVMALRAFFHKQGFSKAVLGLSGGIDSALVAALAAEALGPDNVTAILMPGPYSSEHSITDALACAEALGIHQHTLPITPAYEAMLGSLKDSFEGMPFGLAEENLQARLRGMTLMAWSNKFGALLLNTSNKSEAAVGYGTLYGDMCGALSVIGDVYKTACYALAAHLNTEATANGRPAPIPESTLTKPPSAELRPDQKDSDSLPDYPLLDRVLRAYIEEQLDAEAIIGLGIEGADEDLIKRVIKLVNGAEHKRYQAPPVLRVSAKAFVIGRRMPLVGKLS